METIERMLVIMSLKGIDELVKAKCTVKDMQQKIGGLSYLEFNILQYVALEHYVEQYLGKEIYSNLDKDDYHYVVDYLANSDDELYDEFFTAARALADNGDMKCEDLKKIIEEKRSVDFAHAVFDKNYVLEESIKDFVNSIPLKKELQI